MSKNRREEDEFNDQLRVYRGVIPWSVAEHDSIVAAFDQRRKKNENLPLPEEFADYKEEFESLKGRELENIKEMILFSDIFHKRYPKQLEYDAHFYRFNQINKFMQIHHDELEQLKLVYFKEGKHYVEPKLMEILCTTLYDEEDFDEEGEFTGNTFLFDDVIAQAKGKINKKAGKKPLNEDQGFKGLILWSRAEFEWIMGQQMARGKKSAENEALKDEYLPLKIKLRRETGKKVDNFDTLVVLNEIFHERYPNHIEAMAHFFRYHSIFQFLHEYNKELIKEGLVGVENGNPSFEPELIDSLCILPYSMDDDKESESKGHAFSYEEVVARAKANRSARLN